MTTRLVRRFTVVALLPIARRRLFLVERVELRPETRCWCSEP
jgi:hypothetical protein